MQIEKEVKTLLSSQLYKKLKNTFEWNNFFHQVNYYYDYKNNNDFDTIRVRKKGSKYFLQLKRKIKQNGSFHIKEEYESEIDNVPQKIDKEVIQQLTSIMARDAIYVGELHTLRGVCLYSDTVKIMLDENKYLGTIDYELEIEFTDKLPCSLLKKLVRLGVVFDRKSLSKRNRFKNACQIRKDESV